ncbi:alpha/beta hydrolase [Aestuariimicrobium soli]|uniref:alpha/beta hydrolase n=1 Tax=Aestuariimicrobium soli TaxID=2035834 RepID=UPI003EBEA4C8
MIHARLELFSESLGMCTSVTVLLPQKTTGQIGMAGATSDGKPPVLWLLHGGSDDDTIWLRRTSIERYAAEYGIAVIMPQAALSFYCDEVHGQKWWTWISEELPAILADTFQLSQRREETFVAGLSMGGFGAFKLALNQPGRFAAAASLSGALWSLSPELKERLSERFHHVWGDEGLVEGGPDDLVGLLNTVDKQALPKLWTTCGTEDFLFEDNLVFEKAAAEAGAPLEIEHRPGEHEWGYWDQAIQDVLAWLPIEKAAGTH